MNKKFTSEHFMNYNLKLKLDEVVIENLRDFVSDLEHEIDRLHIDEGLRDEVFQMIAVIANIEDDLQLMVKHIVRDYLTEQFARLAYIEQSIMRLSTIGHEPQ